MTSGMMLEAQRNNPTKEKGRERLGQPHYKDGNHVPHSNQIYFVEPANSGVYGRMRDVGGHPPPHRR